MDLIKPNAPLAYEMPSMLLFPMDKAALGPLNALDV